MDAIFEMIGVLTLIAKSVEAVVLTVSNAYSIRNHLCRL